MTDNIVPPHIRAIIKDPELVQLLADIRTIQNRLLEPDLVNAPYGVASNVIRKEFPHFDKEGFIKNILTGDAYKHMADAIWRNDQVRSGKMTIEDVRTRVYNDFGAGKLLEVPSN